MFILTLESRLIICKYKPFVVAVTGSVGKTSTKDAVFRVLKDQSKFVRKSEKSLNSDIGIPLTIIGVANAWYNVAGWFRNVLAGLRLILRRDEYPSCLILEIGADHPDDIKKVAKWLHPDIAVITKISDMPVHVEFFKSPRQVFEEKAALAAEIKTGGTLALFADDEKVMSLANPAAEGRNVKVISYGMSALATVRGSDNQIIYSQSQISGLKSPAGFSFKITVDNTAMPITVKNVLGQVYMYPLLAAVAVGKARGMTLETVIKALANYEAPRGRMNIISGINDSIIIDDTYNSSPDAAVSALEALGNLECGELSSTLPAGERQNGRRIAILGDMMELGRYSAEEHRKIGRRVGKFVDRLITVGQRSRATAEEALNNGMAASSVRSFDAADEAADYARSILKAGDIVLIKGSQSMRMERITKSLLKEPEKADRLLVRQEKEWLAKTSY